MRTGVTGFAEDLRRQQHGLGKRAPSYQRIMAAVEQALSGELLARFESAWADRRFTAYYDRPLLLLAAIRSQALAEGETHPLWKALGAEEPDPRSVKPSAVRQALDPAREKLWEALATRFVQTNETSRAVAWLWPAHLARLDDGRPLALVDIGASAGLNLVADALPKPWTLPDGMPLPVAEAARVTMRLGLDPRPLDARDEADVAWMRACIWAGERDRLARFEAAVSAFRAACGRGQGPALESVDARATPARLDALCRSLPSEACVLAYQTVMRDYLDPGEREAYSAGTLRWLAEQPRGRALWIELEQPPEASRELPAAIIAHFVDRAGRPRSLLIGRCGYHPSVVAPEPAAAELSP